mgnify:FL=1
MYQWNIPVLYEKLQIDQYDGEFRIQRNQKMDGTMRKR